MHKSRGAKKRHAAAETSQAATAEHLTRDHNAGRSWIARSSWGPLKGWHRAQHRDEEGPSHAR